MVAYVSFGIFLEFLQQFRLAFQLPGDSRLSLRSLEEKVLEVILDEREVLQRLVRPRFPLYLQLGCFLVHRGHEVKVRLAELFLEVHALWLDKLHLVPLLHDLGHSLNILLWVQIVYDLDLPFVVLYVFHGHVVQARAMVHLVEGEHIIVRVGLDGASGQVAEAKPLAAFGAELRLEVSGNGGELEVDLFPAESVLLSEEPDELRHVDRHLLPRRRRRSRRTWTMMLVDSVVVRLQVEITELVSHEEVAVCVNEGTPFVARESARDAPTLPQSQDLLAILAVKD